MTLEPSTPEASYLWLLVYVIWLPGSMLAGGIFPDGAHSEFVRAYAWLSVIIEALLWSWPVMRALEYMGRTLRRIVQGRPDDSPTGRNSPPMTWEPLRNRIRNRISPWQCSTRTATAGS